jgi:cysteinyl-tRNA synthetase
MPLRIHDTRRRKKVEFTTIEPGKVRMYVCGITPYSPSHLGHARCYVAFDIVHRWLESKGYDVTYVQNFTDVDDKIIEQANEEGIEFQEVAERNIIDYYSAMDALNVLRADHYPRVSNSILGIISMIETLLEKENAYVGNDGVYFDVESAPEKYGLLTGQNIEAVQEGAGGRVADTGSGKRDHKDFALWKFSKPGEPEWESPWGNGRPGWHIECSAMSLEYFGEQFDIHGGGQDLRFPHHEAEIFQSECCTGTHPVVHWWMHNGFVNVGGEKMSKSLGNFWTITDALENYPPLVLRHALLNAHYRSPIDLSDQFLEEGERNQTKLEAAYRTALQAWNETPTQKLVAMPKPQFEPDAGSSHDGDGLAHTHATMEKLAEECAKAMDDDFNTREALAKVSAAIRELNRAFEGELDDADRAAFGHYSVEWLEELAGQALGLLPSREDALAGPAEDPKRAEIADQVEELLAKRAEARAAKDWDAADAIRDELTALGVTVKDTPDGPIWNLE